MKKMGFREYFILFLSRLTLSFRIKVLTISMKIGVNFFGDIQTLRPMLAFLGSF